MNSKGFSNATGYNLPSVKLQYKSNIKNDNNVPQSSPMRIRTALDNLHTKIKQLESEKEEALSKYRTMTLVNQRAGNNTFETRRKSQLQYPVVDELNTKLLAAEEKLRRLDEGLEGMREDFNKYQYVYLPLDARQEKGANTSWISKERHRLSDLKIEIKDRIVTLQQELQEEMHVQKMVEDKHKMLKEEEERLNIQLEQQLQQQQLQRQLQLQQDLKTQQEALQQQIQRQRQKLNNRQQNDIFKYQTNNDKTNNYPANIDYDATAAYNNYQPTSTNYPTTNNYANNTDNYVNDTDVNDKNEKSPRDPWVVIQQIRDSISGFPAVSQAEDPPTGESPSSLKQMYCQLVKELQVLQRKYEDLERDRRKVLEEVKRKEKQVKLIEKIMKMNFSF